MPRTVLNRAPVVVFHPVHHRPVGLFRGKELADNDALCTDPLFAWLFVDTTVEKLTSTPIEQATAAPGEKRNTRRL